MSESERPKVGVGVVIHDGKGNIVMGERKSSHGSGTFQCPGGHLESGESFETCAAREVSEETGMDITDIKFLTATNDVFEPTKHYITIFVTARINEESETGSKEPIAMEPDKCAKWEWIPWKQMWTWAGEQAEAERMGRPVNKKMFLPLVNLHETYPELERCLEGR